MQDSEEYLYEVIKCIYECKRFQDENTKEMHYVSKYPNLSNIYPMIFKKACEKSKQKLTLRMQEGYDHSYYFIASFIDDHLNWHHNEI